MKLSYSTNELVLPEAQFGDSEQLAIQVFYGTTMSGKVYSYVRTPANSLYNCRISKLSTADKTALLLFLSTYKAYALTLESDDGLTLTGYLQNDVIEFVTTGGSDEVNRYWSTTLQFRGA